MIDLNVMLDGFLKEAIVAYVESEYTEGPTYVTSTFSHGSLSPGLNIMSGVSEEATEVL